LAAAATEARKTLGIDHVPAFVIGNRVYNTALSWVELKKAIDARSKVLRHAK
jgi:protein-disulfide isomerase